MGFISRMIQKHTHQDNTSDEAVGTEAEVEVEVGGLSTQWPEGLVRELKLDKKNDQALNSLIDFCLFIRPTYLLPTSIHDLCM